MKNNYKIELINGEHGVWVFVRMGNDGVLAEQPGCQTIDEALSYAKAVILHEENKGYYPKPAAKLVFDMDEHDFPGDHHGH